jgi:hypothetical protein
MLAVCFVRRSAGLSPLLPAFSVMLSVQLFCLPCIVVPVFLLAVQFIYNRVPFVKAAVQYFFPSLARAEQQAKQAEEEAARKQAEFFANGTGSNGSGDKDKQNASEDEDAAASTATKRKNAAQDEPAVAKDSAAAGAGASKKDK